MQSEWLNLVTLPRATLAIDPTLRRRHATSLGLFLAILRIDAPGLTTHTSAVKPVDPIRRLVFLKCHSVADLQAADPFTGVSVGIWRSALILGSTVPMPSIATAIRSPRRRHTPHRPRRADRHPPLTGHEAGRRHAVEARHQHIRQIIDRSYGLSSLHPAGADRPRSRPL